MLALLIRKITLYFAKNCELEFFWVQIQWEFASAIPFLVLREGISKRSEGTAPNRKHITITLLNSQFGILFWSKTVVLK